MIARLHDPVMLFRFALREGDWPIAAAVAGALRRDREATHRLEEELSRLPTGELGVSPSLLALRVFGRLVGLLGLDRTAG